MHFLHLAPLGLEQGKVIARPRRDDPPGIQRTQQGSDEAFPVGPPRGLGAGRGIEGCEDGRGCHLPILFPARAYSADFPFFSFEFEFLFE
jgi:hypothetical protein